MFGPDKPHICFVETTETHKNISRTTIESHAEQLYAHADRYVMSVSRAEAHATTTSWGMHLQVRSVTHGLKSMRQNNSGLVLYATSEPST